MTNSELIAELEKFDGAADVQIWHCDDPENSAYYDVGKVVPIAGLIDVIIETGELRCTAP